ncbi:hypothetical protein RHMOL_Rhmol06G0278600 [Rhododendron molle]|uniref:Uncharacterized protein n=1 Tax=Rhododendron molle TaxID=49168 RepID=A0ACC0NIA0_RHOML|nr:hypothetical protein RHMOL_Rhmol06G0278600 [Rhododendron molle]
MTGGSKNTGVGESSVGASVIKPELSPPVPSGKVRWDELAQYDPVSDFGATSDVAVKRMDRLHTYSVLMGLKPEFESLRGQILNTSPLPSLLDSFAILDGDGRRRLISTPTLSPIVGVVFD